MRHLRVAVNLSARQFGVESLPQDISAVLRESRLEGEDLEVEITESMVMSNPDQAVTVLRQLKDMGIHVAIDDFGTGYSSLAYLKRFPVDSVKLDRSFVEDLPGDLESVAIAQAIIAMAHSLHMKVVAEGVENEAQLRFLRGEGCDEIQGHHFSEPRAAFEIPELMRKTLRPSGPLFVAERRRKVS